MPKPVPSSKEFEISCDECGNEYTLICTDFDPNYPPVWCAICGSTVEVADRDYIEDDIIPDEDTEDS